MPNTGNLNSTAKNRICQNCHGPIIGRTGNAKYCSDRCRWRVARRRNYHANIEKGRAANRASHARRKAARLARANRPVPSLWRKLRALVTRLLVGGAK